MEDQFQYVPPLPPKRNTSLVVQMNDIEVSSQSPQSLSHSRCSTAVSSLSNTQSGGRRISVPRKPVSVIRTSEEDQDIVQMQSQHQSVMSRFTAEECKNTVQILKESSTIVEGGIPLNTILSGTLKKGGHLAQDLATSEAFLSAQSYNSVNDIEGEERKFIHRDQMRLAQEYLKQDDQYLGKYFLRLVNYISKTDNSPIYDKLDKTQFLSWKQSYKQLQMVDDNLACLKSKYEKEKKFRNAALQMLQLYTSSKPISLSSSSGKVNSSKSKPSYIARKNKRSESNKDPEYHRSDQMSQHSQPSFTEDSGVLKLGRFGGGSKHQDAEAIMAATEAYFESTGNLYELGDQIIQLQELKAELNGQIWFPINNCWLSAYTNMKKDKFEVEIELIRARNILNSLQNGDGVNSTGTRSKSFVHTAEYNDLALQLMKDRQIRAMGNLFQSQS
ncbi:hypothetical protein MP228_005457 [Amoeboaphelidium protococcarum]|nr:hypothetical protein MP228_005457 [Amoeboaphelidium protococcarum]